MTKQEFAPILAYLETACGVPAEKTTDKMRSKVYFDLLSDLPATVVEAASKQAVLNHPYPNLPPVGAVRKLAIAMQRPTAAGPEAWQAALTAVSRFGTGSGFHWDGKRHVKHADGEQAALESLAPPVRQAVQAFGYRVIANAKADELGIVQTQFLKVFAELSSREEQRAIMPPSVARIAGQLAEAFSSDAKQMPALDK